MDTRAYWRILSRLPQLGFLAIGIDAVDHGDSGSLPGGSFAERADVLRRTLDHLGVRQAVIAGHSMGGRNVLELAAARPESALAALLINAAAGAPFDSISAISTTGRRYYAALGEAIVDTLRDTRLVSTRNRRIYRRTLSRLFSINMRQPRRMFGTIRALRVARPSVELLEELRRNKVHTTVLHGTDDGVIPFAAGVDAARRSEGGLLVLERAHHSWLLADPAAAIDAIELLLGCGLEEAIRSRAGSVIRAEEAVADDWHRAFLAPDAPVLAMRPPLERMLSRRTDRVRAGLTTYDMRYFATVPDDLNV
jgi:pimeloyl-ACP methyl ester carboxylesterase